MGIMVRIGTRYSVYPNTIYEYLSRAQLIEYPQLIILLSN